MQTRLIGLSLTCLLLTTGLVFHTISLTGCVSNSPGLSNIFIVAIKSSPATEVRIGYFGVCVINQEGKGSPACIASPYSTTAQSLHTALSSQLGLVDKGSSIPSVSTLDIALELQQGVFFCLQAFSGVLLLISILLFTTQVFIKVSKGTERTRRFIDQRWSEKILLISAVISVISAASTTQTGNALQFSTERIGGISLHIKVGRALQMLEWFAFASSAICYIAVTKGLASKTEEVEDGVEDEDELLRRKKSLGSTALGFNRPQVQPLAQLRNPKNTQAQTPLKIPPPSY